MINYLAMTYLQILTMYRMYHIQWNNEQRNSYSYMTSILIKNVWHPFYVGPNIK